MMSSVNGLHQNSKRKHAKKSGYFIPCPQTHLCKQTLFIRHGTNVKNFISRHFCLVEHLENSSHELKTKSRTEEYTTLSRTVTLPNSQVVDNYTEDINYANEDSDNEETEFTTNNFLNCVEIDLCKDGSKPFEDNLILGAVQIESMKASNTKVDLYNAIVNMNIINAQDEDTAKFDPKRLTENILGIRSPKGSNGMKINPLDLIDIQECATDLKLSIPETQKLIDMQQRLIVRHQLPIVIHKKALTLKNACARFMDDTHTIHRHGME